MHTCEGTVTITGAGAGATARQADERNEQVTFKNCAPFISCTSQINNPQYDDAEFLDIVVLVYNLIEYSDNYAKTSGSLWQYHNDIPNDHKANFESLQFKARITGKTPADGNTKNVEIVIKLKYMSNFLRTLESSLINSEINLQLTWSANCVITNSSGIGTFAMSNTGLYVSVVTLSTQDNTKLQQ